MYNVYVIARSRVLGGRWCIWPGAGKRCRQGVFCPRWYVILCEVITLKSDMTQSRDVLQNWRAFVCYGRCHHQNQSPGWGAFQRRSKFLLVGYISIRAGGAFQSEGVHFNRSRCISNGRVHFNWSGYISTGASTFPLEGVHFNWRWCISTEECISIGGGAFQLEGCISIGGGAFQLEGCISIGGGAFQLEGCISIGGGAILNWRGAFQLEVVHFNWRGVFQLEVVHFNWRGAFQLEVVHFNWRGAFQLEVVHFNWRGAFQLEGVQF